MKRGHKIKQNPILIAEKVFGKQRTKQLIQETKILFKQLFPICRSITGNGVRQTFKILRKFVKFNVIEIPSGTVCYDWVIPQEWNISEAYIQDSRKKIIVDFTKNNLHMLNYSMPIDAWLTFEELAKHLYFLPDYPNAIPYRTSYYKKQWGFCISYKQYCELNRSEKYHVYINSSFKNGSLSYGEKILKGQTESELLLSTYCCHPSLANDNLSGMVLWALLLREMELRKNRFTYRFVIAPETIGSICYLAQHEKDIKNIKGGFVITTVAGPGPFGYKHTYLENDLIDRVVRKTFAEENLPFRSYPFDINGSDESRYSSPSFRIPMGTICKDKYYEYDSYHTSLDNLSFIKTEYLIETLAIYYMSIMKLEKNYTYISKIRCEPMLSKRNLYPVIGGLINQKAANIKLNHEHIKYRVSTTKKISGIFLNAIKWLHFYGDGKKSLMDISEKTHIPLEELYTAAEILRKHNLLKRI